MMTKRLLGVLILLLSIIFIYLLGTPHGGSPALGFLLSPTHGFWSNIEDGSHTESKIQHLNTPDGSADIVYDENHIPHIFADNEKALYYAQGYVMAKDRLWQMEFISLLASGRLSEIVGEKALPLDQYHRRIGLRRAAENSLKTILENEATKNAVLSFSEGVNQFIKEAKRGNLPIEYKLMGYRPEKWQPINSVLLLKFMANDLTANDNDIEFTNALHLFGREIFDILYPDEPSSLDPIIPLSVSYNYNALPAPQLPNEKDISLLSTLYKNPIRDFYPQRGLGSNNWAVSGAKTASGTPILCNDPHLALSFPSIWYEMQLKTPDMNVYGVTLPGAPGIIIGYNESIAWGVTNAGMDVRDWFIVERNPANADQYKLEGKWVDFENVEETFKIKGAKDIKNTIKWTKIGPIVYDKDFGQVKDKLDLTMSWTALFDTNELLAFLDLNKSKNHNDYLDAIAHFRCPAQNFVYADIDGDIAIKENGSFWVRYPEQGKFVQKLSDANVKQIQSYFIPDDQLPYVLNPERGFVSSANQIPTGTNYPYYVYGFDYENYRNRRINEVLASSQNITVEDMKKLHYDNVSIHAREALPVMLPYLSGTEYSKSDIYKELSLWDYHTDVHSKAASYFYKWWEEFENLAWDELKSTDDASFVLPEEYTSVDIMKNHPDFSLFDIQATQKVETLKDILMMSMDATISWFKENTDKEDFQYYKNTSISHLAQIDEFSMHNLNIGGYSHTVNATSSRWGSSVRYIIDFKSGRPQGYGMYPGGESGNPASPAYSNYVKAWEEGKYYTHHFYRDLDDAVKDLKR